MLPRMVSGGVERVTLNLVSQFVKDGVECRIALGRCYGELLPEAESLASVEELAPRGMHQFVPVLSSVIRSWQPTHVVTAFADVAALTWLAMRLAQSDARWVHGVHNTHALVAARPGIGGALRYRIDNAMARFVYRRASVIVAVSEGVRREILQRFGISPTRVKTIYNPVVSDGELRVVPEPRHPADQPFRIVAIGRLTRQKGFDVLIRAMAKVSPPWQLDIWGEGPERRQLEQLITSHGLGSAIHLRGYTPGPFIVLRQADLFVLPSRYEGLPTTLIEGLACQCRIVASDCPHGPREILQNGKLGRLVQPEDVDELAGAIRDVVAGRARVKTSQLLQRAGLFSVRSATKRWLDVMRSA